MAVEAVRPGPSVGSRTASLARDGYVVLPGFVRSSELADIRAEVDAHVSAPYEPSCERPHNTLLPLRWSDRLVDLFLASRARTEALRAAVDADDLRWISGYISIKDAHSSPLWWHQDWWCWDHPISFGRSAAQIAVLCYLSDTDDRRGALRVLPGSHVRSFDVHAALPEAHTSAGPLPSNHPAVRDHAEQVTLAVSAGDAVALDYRLLHGTHANRAGARRDCVLLSFAPSWSGLPAGVRGHLISHPSQPQPAEQPAASWSAGLLPTFDGPRRDLPLNRIPPAEFFVA